MITPQFFIDRKKIIPLYLLNLLSKVKNVQVCDTRADAMKNQSRQQNLIALSQQENHCRNHNSPGIAEHHCISSLIPELFAANNF